MASTTCTLMGLRSSDYDKEMQALTFLSRTLKKAAQARPEISSATPSRIPSLGSADTTDGGESVEGDTSDRDSSTSSDDVEKKKTMLEDCHHMLPSELLRDEFLHVMVEPVLGNQALEVGGPVLAPDNLQSSSSLSPFLDAMAARDEGSKVSHAPMQQRSPPRAQEALRVFQQGTMATSDRRRSGDAKMVKARRERVPLKVKSHTMSPEVLEQSFQFLDPELPAKKRAPYAAVGGDPAVQLEMLYAGVPVKKVVPAFLLQEPPSVLQLPPGLAPHQPGHINL